MLADMLKASLGCMWVPVVSKVVILMKEEEGRAGAVVVQLITLSEMYWGKNWRSGCDQKFDPS